MLYVVLMLKTCFAGGGVVVIVRGEVTSSKEGDTGTRRASLF